MRMFPAFVISQHFATMGFRDSAGVLLQPGVVILRVLC